MDSSIDESPAVKALGPLFKLTEFHLRGDGLTRESSYFQEPTKLDDGNKVSGKSDYARIRGFYSLIEDVELAKELNDLGLPLSFLTNKEKRNGMTSGKRKGSRKTNQQCPTEIGNYTQDVLEVSDGSRSPVSLLNTSKNTEQIAMLKRGISTDIDLSSNLSLEQVDSIGFTACTSTFGNEHGSNGEASDLGFDHSLDCSSEPGSNLWVEIESTPCTNEMMSAGLCINVGHSEGSCLINEDADGEGKGVKEELDSVHHEALIEMDHDTQGQSDDISLLLMQASDIAAHEHFSEPAKCCMIDNHPPADSEEWIAYWDDFHMRTYFYNVKKEESTWDPPSGMEHLVYGSIADEPANIVDGLAEVDDDRMDLREFDVVQPSCDLEPHLHLAKESGEGNGRTSQLMDETSGNWLSGDNVSSTKRTKKERKKKSNRKLSISSEDHLGVLQESVPSIRKYWCQRHLLFSRFDDGIKMDEEGWYSVTPEPLAEHHAVRCGSGSIVDFFTGVGGNAIQFAQWSTHVIAVDIDPNKIEYAQHNATIYGVEGKIDFIKGDSFSLAPKLKADAVFMSPPWGGPDYSKVKKFDINTMLKPRDGQSLFNAGMLIAPKIVMFLPKNVDINQLAELSLSATPPWSLEVETNFWNGRLKAITAYFSKPSMS